MILMIILIYL